MDSTLLILGPVVTEKAERGKEQRTYTLRVRPEATKIDVKRALKKFYDVDAESIRVQRVRPKERLVGNGRVIQKRAPWKKMVITLAPKSKPLDLVQFKTLS